jgi:hypothetical protein
MTRFRLAVTVCLLIVVPMAVVPATGDEIGQIKTVTGEVTIIRSTVQQPARVGDLLEVSDTLVTGAESSVGVTFIDNSRLSVGPHSRIELQQFRFNPTTQEGESLTEVKRGTLAIISGQIAKQSPEAMKVKTPTTILGVRGTKFVVQVQE